MGSPLKNSQLVVKSNRLIEASYRLGLNEQRIILYAICRAREEQKGLLPDQPVTISAEAFSHQFALSDEMSNVYRQLREAMDALFERSVTMHDIDPETSRPRIRRVRWISEASYIDGAGRVQVVFAHEVIKYITRLEKEFTSYQLEKVGRMTSAYAVRLYELLIQYSETGTRELNLAWLRDVLQIEPGEYKLTADFIKRVLDVSVEQINKHTDLSISYKAKKTGRAITDFVFRIKSKDIKLKRQVLTDQELRDQLEARGQQRIDDSTEDF